MLRVKPYAVLLCGLLAAPSASMNCSLRNCLADGDCPPDIRLGHLICAQSMLRGGWRGPWAGSFHSYYWVDRESGYTASLAHRSCRFMTLQRSPRLRNFSEQYIHRRHDLGLRLQQNSKTREKPIYAKIRPRFIRVSNREREGSNAKGYSATRRLL